MNQQGKKETPEGVEYDSPSLLPQAPISSRICLGYSPRLWVNGVELQVDGDFELEGFIDA